MSSILPKQLCSVCNKTYSSREGLNKHTRTAHSSKLLKSTCTICSKTFYNSTSLLKHKKSTQHFNLHDVVTPKVKKIQCDYCNFQTNSQPTYYAHFKTNHSTLALSSKTKKTNSFLFLQHVYRCPFDLCHMSTFSKDSMTYHFHKVHTSSETFMAHLDKYAFVLCKKCNLKIKNEDYKTHISNCI